MTDLQTLLELAKNTAREAGALLADAPADFKKIDQQHHHDIKLKADKISESFILERLKKTSFPILSEETILISQRPEGLHWIVDPLDGTINYFRGIPMYCVSIGLWEGDRPVLGAVYSPQNEELFLGLVGKGAWLNDSPIKVSDVSYKDKAMLLTGFALNTNYSTEFFNQFKNDVQAYQKLRWLGSAALSLSYISCGRGEVYSEKGIMVWDIAGALPILIAAGGSFTLEKTDIPNCINLTATNGKMV